MNVELVLASHITIDATPDARGVVVVLAHVKDERTIALVVNSN